MDTAVATVTSKDNYTIFKPVFGNSDSLPNISVVNWIYHECFGLMIYSLMTDQLLVIYWATNLLLNKSKNLFRF